MIFNFNVFSGTHQQATASTIERNAAITLTRRFVLTGDERCPIAGIWSRLDAGIPDFTDEPSLTRPAMGMLLWRAIHLLFTKLRYLPA